MCILCIPTAHKIKGPNSDIPKSFNCLIIQNLKISSCLKNLNCKLLCRILRCVNYDSSIKEVPGKKVRCNLQCTQWFTAVSECLSKSGTSMGGEIKQKPFVG